MHKLTSTSIYFTYKRVINDRISCPDSFAEVEKKNNNNNDSTDHFNFR